MTEVLPLTTIGIIIILAIVLSIIVRKMGQNPVLGYIVAGFLLGPFFIGFLHPEDPLVVGFGELGLFILLFYLGLELSLKDFIEAGINSFGLALLDMLGSIGFGFLVSYLFGYSLLFSIVIGFMLFSTSTAIVAKFVLDNNLINLPPAKMALSILILQDFLGVLLIVFATTLSKSGTALSLGLAALMFATATFFAVYQLSQRVEDWLMKHEFSHIEVTLYALGIGLIVATLASILNLSTALGAYFAGFALAETRAGKKIKEDIRFLRDFFLVFFFVSFGTTIFYSHEAGTIVIPMTSSLLSLFGFVLILGLGAIAMHSIVFAIFSPYFGLKKEDASLAAIMLSPLGEFVIIIASTSIAVLPAQEALILPSIAFLLIAITVILFQPMYSNIALHRKLMSFIPSLQPKRKESIVIKHTSESIEQLKAIALNAFVILSFASITLLLYYDLPRFGVPIIYSRQITAFLIFAVFASVPFYKCMRAVRKLFWLIRHKTNH